MPYILLTSAQSFRRRGLNVSEDQIPRLARGCRLREVEGQEPTLQIPEGQMKMTGSGLEILKLCDGQRTVADIVRLLSEKYTTASPEKIQHETLSFLKRLNERAVLIFL
jgi:pyrroloquinoline quinone biosynthesis protein D